MDNIKQEISEIKSAAAFAKDEADDIKVGMEALAESLSYNVKLLLEISTSHTKVTNELKDRIDALEAQLESTNTKNTGIDALAQSQNTKQGIQTGTPSGSSGGPSQIKRDTIMESPRKVTIKNDDKHTRVIKIRADEDDETPLTPREEEYKAFAKLVYELQDNESYFISPGEHVYPRMIITNDGDPNMVKMAADYGFLDLIYPGKDLKEIEKFDDIFRGEVSKFAKGRPIYLKFYSISPEIDGRIYYPAEHIITIGYVGRNFQIEVGQNRKSLPNINRSWMRSRRVLGMKVLYNMAKNLYDKKFQCLCQYEGWTLMTNNGNDKSTILKEYIQKFDIHQIHGSPSTIQESCQLRECPTCYPNEKRPRHYEES